jgi:asparagine synthase (glutamine-hydrolysing)
MCGIAGIVRFDGAPVQEDALRRMTAQITHRGPDDEGYLVRGHVGFGHRRLSIIDVAGSPQPMSSVDGSLHVCFNGEILNYAELRRAYPYPYRTGGDTEVLLSMFERDGIASVKRLFGQFAYSLYDERERTLWLTRDRLGILPLYWYRDESQFLFASEIKALLAVLPAPSVDLASVGDYLARRSVPAPWTMFEGIRKLPAGCTLRVGSDGVVAEPERYWTVPAAGPARALDDHEAVEEFASVLRTAVRRNLVADVPVGAYLSGGIDSSLIVSVMRELGPEQEIQTFAATFGDPRFDETPYARTVSNLHRTVHHEVHVRADDFREQWPLLTWHRDGPISEASDVAVYHLARLVSQHVKVVLSGEGSDELFAGYPKHVFAVLGERSAAVPAGVRRALLGAVERRLPPRLARQRIALRALMADNEADRIESWFAPFTTPERALLLGGAPEHARHPDLSRHGDPLRRMLASDLQGWLTDNLLERGDRMTMAASVELRPPFLDAEVVEWAMALPPAAKIRGRTTKWIVRRLAARYLPPEIIERPKVGFRVPLDAWFRGSLRGFVHEALLSPESFVGSTLNRDYVATLVRRHCDGHADESLRLWTLLSLEIWHRVFFTAGTRSGNGAVAPVDGHAALSAVAAARPSASQ